MMWRWLDRERRIHEEKVLRKEAAESNRMWFRLYQRSLVERQSLTAQLADVDGMLVEEMARADRYRLAWLSARARAATTRPALAAATGKVESLSRLVEISRGELMSARKTWYAERQQLVTAKNDAQSELASRLVPAPSVRVHPDDRAGLYRLETENARLRDLLAKYEGNPS